MKLDVDNGDYGSLYDALDRIILIPISGDTHTGECVCAVMKPDGSILIDEEKGEVVREWRRYLAPLRFEQAVPGKLLGQADRLELLKTSEVAVPLEVRRL